jgi:hypothetical protein
MSASATPELRALKRLSAAGMFALPEPGSEATYAVYPNGDRRRRALARLPEPSVTRLLSSGALGHAANGRGVVITEEGRALLRRTDSEPALAFRAQHMELGPAPQSDGESADPRRMIKLDESPLAWLARRTDRNGDPFLSSRDLLAGERLRTDYHKGRYHGRVTSDWTAPPRGSSPRGPGRGQLDPAESVIAARDRVAAALRHVGSGLDRVLNAVCLEGRGLDDIERGFGWPKRSGKIVLKLALARLADHYGYPPERAS